MAQITQPVLTDILHLMTHNDLELFKRKGSRAPLDVRIAYEKSLKSEQYKKGVIFVSPSKEKLSNGVGHIVTSYETLNEQYNTLTHWTPNTYRGGTYYDFQKRIIKGHTKDNLKQINVIGFDIDTKEISPFEIFIACIQEDLPRLNLVIETPNGYQGFFVLTSPFFVTQKSLAVADRLATNVIAALRKHLPIDSNCNPFGFFRMPHDNNVVYFDDELVNTYSFLEWSKEYDKKIKRKLFQVIDGGSNASALDYTSSDWYEALINATDIESGHHASSRNNALLTLALAAYASGKDFHEAYDQLDQFNSNLSKPLSKTEFERTMKSAYSGKYKGPKRSYVEGLLEMWTPGNAKFQGREGWHKFKRKREDRVRSHYSEWEEDIIDYLNGRITPEQPFYKASLKEMSITFGIALSSLKEVLKRSKQLVKQVEGRGRGAVTMLSTKIVLLRSVLRKQKEKMVQAQLSYREYVIIDEMIRSVFDLPLINFAMNYYKENERNVENGPSPPIRSVL